MTEKKRKISHAGARLKGAAFEREVAATVNDGSLWLHAIKVPLSGAVAHYPGDVIVRTLASAKGDPSTIAMHKERTLECKKRENISKQLWEWLDGNDALVIGRNRYYPLVVMTLGNAVKLWEKDQ